MTRTDAKYTLCTRVYFTSFGLNGAAITQRMKISVWVPITKNGTIFGQNFPHSLLSFPFFFFFFPSCSWEKACRHFRQHISDTVPLSLSPGPVWRSHRSRCVSLFHDGPDILPMRACVPVSDLRLSGPRTVPVHSFRIQKHKRPPQNINKNYRQQNIPQKSTLLHRSTTTRLWTSVRPS